MTLYELLLTKLIAHKKHAEERLLRGNFDDIQSYKLMVGKLQGINESYEIITKTIKEGSYE